MSSSYKIDKQSDLLIGLFITQCADLESMLKLEKACILAARDGDYERVLKFNSEREALYEKIETFQRQTSNLRERLGKNVELVWESEIMTRMSEVIHLFNSPNENRLLLGNIARKKSVETLSSSSRTESNSNLNLDKKQKSLIFDGVFTR